MDHEEVGQYWDANAPAWTKLARAGYDVYRDCINTPAFMDMLPDVNGLAGLDIGCGEGHNTRLLARRAARMTAIDISANFLAAASREEQDRPLGIDYRLASAVDLPFADRSFDFAVAFMSLMDIPESDLAIAQAWRVLKPGGFLQFSITHPCFMTPRWKWVRDEAGNRIGVVCGEYFTSAQGRIDEWIFMAAPEQAREGLPKFKTPRFDRPLSWWLNTLISAGLVLERVNEPYADEDLARRVPYVADTRIIAYFLHVLCRKPTTPPALP